MCGTEFVLNLHREHLHKELTLLNFSYVFLLMHVLSAFLLTSSSVSATFLLIADSRTRHTLIGTPPVLTQEKWDICSSHCFSFCTKIHICPFGFRIALRVHAVLLYIVFAKSFPDSLFPILKCLCKCLY